MGRISKRKISSRKNANKLRTRRLINIHQTQTDQQQIRSSEHSSSEIVENGLQHFPPQRQSDEHFSTYKTSLSPVEPQQISTPYSENTELLSKESSTDLSSSASENVGNALQHSNTYSSTAELSEPYFFNIEHINSMPHSESPSFLSQGSSEHSSSEIAENAPQQSYTYSSNFKANLPQTEPQSTCSPHSANTTFLFKDSSEQSSSEIAENGLQHFPPLQQPEEHSSTFKPKLSHIEPQLISPPHSANPAFPFEGSPEYLSSSSSVFVRNDLQLSSTHSSTSKPNLSHIEPQLTSSSQSTRNAFLGHNNLDESNFESITTKCANCNWIFEEEIERNVKFNLLNGNNNEIQIIDAIFSIYGLTVADWSQTLTSDAVDGSVFTYVSELVFEKGISFCSSCSLALQNVYTSHQTLKKFAHNESLFTKALNTQSSCKMQIKTESGDENEVLHTNDHKTGHQEAKDEGNELEDSFFEPMMDEDFDLEDPLELEDNLDKLRPSLFTHFLSTNATAIVTESHYDLSTTDVRPKMKGTKQNCLKPKRKGRPPGKRDIKLKMEQIYLEPSDEADEPNEESLWSLREIKELNKKLGTDGYLEENLRDCFVRIEQMPLDPYGSKYAFNIICCGTPFYRKWEFIRHLPMMHDEEELSQKLPKCGICERVISFDNILKHMNTIGSINAIRFECTKCDMKFWHRCGLVKHMKTHDPNYVSWWCDICEIHLKSESYSIVHKVMKHSETPEAEKVFPCNQCEAKFVELKHFRRHYYETHRPAEDRTCTICDIVFLTSKACYTHCRVKHSELVSAKYACDICNLKFQRATCLQKHKEKNICADLNERVVCEKCGKDFLNNSYLRKHMQQHADIENPHKEQFKCHICEKTLKHRISLREHLARQHPKQPKKLFYCEKCGKTTKNLGNMRIHMKVHENKE